MTNLEKIVQVNKEHFINMIVQSYCITDDYEILRAKAMQTYPCSKCRFNSTTCQKDMREWLLEEVDND